MHLTHYHSASEYLSWEQMVIFNVWLRKWNAFCGILFRGRKLKRFVIRCKRERTLQTKIIAFKCKNLLRVRWNVTKERKIGEFGSWRQRKILIVASKFDKFCYRKFDKRRISFCTGFVERLRHAFIILRSWMVAMVILDFSVTRAKSQSETDKFLRLFLEFFQLL